MRTFIPQAVIGAIVAAAAATQVPAQAAAQQQSRDEILYITGGRSVSNGRSLSRV